MVVVFILIELLVLFIFLKIFFDWIADFKIKRSKLMIFLIPLIVFIVGFSLRISGSKNMIDLGYFMTEFSTLSATVLFTVCLFLGQLKYWKIK